MHGVVSTGLRCGDPLVCKVCRISGRRLELRVVVSIIFSAECTHTNSMASSFDAMARICPLLSIEATVVADYRVLGDHTTLLVVYYL